MLLKPLAKVSKEGRFPMLYLSDSIRHDDPSVQRLLRAVEDAQTLTALLLAAWSLARVVTVHVVEYVLAERACRTTFWPRCPACGACLRSKRFVKRQVTSLFGPIRCGAASDDVRRDATSSRWRPWIRHSDCSHSSVPAVTSSPWAVRCCLCAVCYVARLLGWYSEVRQPPGGMGVGASGRHRL